MYRQAHPLLHTKSAELPSPRPSVSLSVLAYCRFQAPAAKEVEGEVVRMSHRALAESPAPPPEKGQYSHQVWIGAKRESYGTGTGQDMVERRSR